MIFITDIMYTCDEIQKASFSDQKRLSNFYNNGILRNLVNFSR